MKYIFVLITILVAVSAKRNMERRFVFATLQKQLEIARNVRDMQNSDYILFDPNFVCNTTKMVGKFRVEVDKDGREAILSYGAQKSFNVEKYMNFMVGQKDVTRSGSVVTLGRK